MQHPEASPAVPTSPPSPSPERLEAIESLAVELARLGGREIVSALTREVTVEYKDAHPRTGEPRDPVSEIDRAIELQIRRRIGECFPDHAIIGEEIDDGATEHPYVWVVDPVDGTTNFVNGYPMFACSIGVLHAGRPVVGAIWCSTGHALGPGVYHAREGGALRFEEQPLRLGRPATGVRRRLSAAPGGWRERAADWDHRATGSAALEMAFVAAGIFRAAHFWGPALWDVAGGIPLARAAGLEAWTRRGGMWVPLDRFVPPAGPGAPLAAAAPPAAAPPGAAPPGAAPRGAGTGGGDAANERRAPALRDWRAPLIVGDAEAVAAIRRSLTTSSGWRARLGRRLGRWLAPGR